MISCLVASYVTVQEIQISKYLSLYVRMQELIKGTISLSFMFVMFMSPRNVRNKNSTQVLTFDFKSTGWKIP